MPRTVAARRIIKHLYHFTRASNLPGILTNGIIARSVLQNSGAVFTFNDEVRLDNRESRSCLSISFPNCKMLYQKMQEFPKDDWAVLRLNPSILWEHDCLFVVTNAATTTIRNAPDAQLKGADALERLFGNDEARRQAGRLVHETTDVQAEVLVSGTILPHHIVNVNFHYQNKLNDFKGLEALSNKSNKFIWQFDPDLFYQRKDADNG